jgi:hypothetical protein
MQPYEKFLSKIEQELASLRIEIEELPNINPLTLPLMLIESLLKPERFDKLRILRERLDTLKGKAKSALDTYSRGDREGDGTTYLSRITGVTKEINLLTVLLSKKDFHLLMNNDDSSSNMRSRARNENKNETDWNDLDLNS